MRRRPTGFTLIEVMIALSLAAAIFAAALQLLLGMLTAWERAKEGDLEADEKFRLFAFLKNYLEEGGEDEVRIENLPGERGEMYLTFSIENSPLTRSLSEEWRTERYALVPDREAIRLLPFVEEDEDRPQIDDGLALFGEGVELEYWTWDASRENWDDTDSLDTRGGQDPDLPGYLIIRFSEDDRRWIRIGGGEGGQAIW
tara:strand:- start:15821 stop:16420 length:600 start_codon:yes stop_codon:yes gene_type:complete